MQQGPAGEVVAQTGSGQTGVLSQDLPQRGDVAAPHGRDRPPDELGPTGHKPDVSRP
jgi:hypothetical protein